MASTKWVTDETFAAEGAAGPRVRSGMAVVGSDGRKVGVVDQAGDRTIKLTRASSPDGLHHFLPREWVTRVDDTVHLTKDAGDIEMYWLPDPASLRGD